MEVDIIVWIVVLAAAVVIEIISLGLTSIWFAGGALSALIVAILGGPLWLQIICFVIISVLLLLFTRPIAVKYFNKDREKTNVDSIVGKQGIVQTEINNLKGTGVVSIAGMEWSAKSSDDTVILPQGTVVEVVEVSGVKVICKPEAVPVATQTMPVQNAE